MRNAPAIILALALTTGSVAAQDVCAGAPRGAGGTVSLKSAVGATSGVRSGAQAAIAGGQVGVARGASLYPGSGTGPVPDITDWQPHGGITLGNDLVIQGRNLVPAQLVVMLGGSPLTQTAQSSSEIRYKVTDPAPGAALVAYYMNGQPKTLESAYVVYDSKIAITRVVPSEFGPGDVVTICGSALSGALLYQQYSRVPVPSMTFYNSVSMLTGKFVRIGGDAWLYMAEPVVVAPAGDRISFVAGALFTTAFTCNGSVGCSTATDKYIITIPAAFAAPPTTLAGPLYVALAGATRYAIGPSVTWRKGIPRITRAYGNYLSDHDPFVLLPTTSTPPFQPTAFVEGANLGDVTWKIGAVAIPASAVAQASAVLAKLTLPLNVSSGPLCATSLTNTGCSPTPLQVFGGPVLSRTPPMPLLVRTSYTIEGLNLLPPATVAGLKYRFVMTGLDSTAATLACNTMLQVLDHTMNHIVFRIGDPAKTGALPANCASDPHFQQSAQWAMNINATLAGTTGVRALLNPLPFFLKR